MNNFKLQDWKKRKKRPRDRPTSAKEEKRKKGEDWRTQGRKKTGAALAELSAERGKRGPILSPSVAFPERKKKKWRPHGGIDRRRLWRHKPKIPLQESAKVR